MRALFIKEFRQGRPLVVFAAIMALLVPLCYLVLARAAFLYLEGYDTQWLPIIAGFAVFGLPMFLAAFASAGLFCSEAHWGTLPILFALPLSRRRIWLAKLLAACALTLVGSLLVLVIGGALLPGAYGYLPIAYHLLDLCCWLVFLLAVGAWCSSLSRSINAALPSTALLAGAIIAGASTLRFYYGAPLVGPPWLDVALWCVCTSPALLLGSALVVTKGELLQSARKWLFGVPPMLLATGLIVLLVIGAARATTRYHRSEVSEVTQVSNPEGGRAVCLLSHGQPFQFLPQWLVSVLLREQAEQGLFPDEFDADDVPAFYRANYAIVLDLTSGRELSHVRAPLDYQDWQRYDNPAPTTGACSRDGRLAAFVTEPAGFTWGVRRNRPVQLRILDAGQGKVLYSGWPERAPTDMWDSSFELRWSPSGEYLALSKDTQGGPHGANVMMYLLRSDGSYSRARPLLLGSACWAPDEDVIYGFDSQGNLARAYPDDRPNEIIWASEAAPEQASRWFQRESISPDGKWVAVFHAEAREGEPPPGKASAIQTLWLVATDGSGARLIWREERRDHSLRGDAVWSGDGSALFFQLGIRDWPSRTSSFQLLCWKDASSEVGEVGPATSVFPTRLFGRPASNQVAYWGLRYEWGGELGREWRRLVGGSLALADSSGGWRLLPSEEESSRFGMDHEPVGFDSKGRLLLLAGGPGLDQFLEWGTRYGRLEALDPETGKVETVYP